MTVTLTPAIPPLDASVVKAVVFDAYGTLIDFASGTERLRPTIGDQTDRLIQVWRQKQLEYSWLRSLMGRWEDFWHVTGEALDYAMLAVDLPEPALRARLMESFFALDAYPDAVPALTRLRASGRRTAILSNGSTTMLASAVGTAGLRDLVDQVLSADAVKVFKPSPEVYQLACERLQVDPPEIAFVSGNAWDGAGAAAFGFQVIRLDRAGTPADCLPGRPRAEITSLEDLPGLIGAV